MKKLRGLWGLKQLYSLSLSLSQCTFVLLFFFRAWAQRDIVAVCWSDLFVLGLCQASDQVNRTSPRDAGLDLSEGASNGRGKCSVPVWGLYFHCFRKKAAVFNVLRIF